MADVDKFLLQQFKRIGITPSASLQQAGGATGLTDLPPQTAGLPKPDDYLKSLFEKSAMQQNLEGREGGPGLMQMALTPLKWLAHALSAGEYAVASMLKAATDEDEATDPFSSFLKGVAAGFNDDEEYKVRMYDLLGEWGIDPETTTGEWGKTALGFAMGVALDPLFWTGYGPLIRAMKVGKETIAKPLAELVKTVPGAFPKKLLRKLGGGQYVSAKHGRRGLAAITKAFLPFTKQAAGGGVSLLRKGAMEKLEQIAKTVPKEAAEAAAKTPAVQLSEEIVGKVMAEDEGLQALLRAALPVKGEALKDYLARNIVEVVPGKKVNVVDVLLESMGKKPTKQLRKWFMEEGRDLMWDPGKFKLGIPFTGWELHLGKAHVMGPRSAGFFGLIAGNSLKYNMPIIDKAVESLGKSSYWEKAVTKPKNAVLGKLSKTFRAKHGLNQYMRAVRSFAHGNERYAISAASRIAHSAMYVDDLAKGIRKLSNKETRLLTQVLFDANMADVADDAFAGWMREKLRDAPDKQFADTMKDLKLVADDKLIQDLTQAGTRIRGLFKALSEFDKQYGRAYDDLISYFPFVPGVGEVADIPQLAVRSGGIGASAKLPFERFRATKSMRYATLRNSGLELGVGKGKVFAKPSTDLEYTVFKRLAGSFGPAFQHDVAQMALPQAGSHLIHAGKGAKFYDDAIREMLKDDTFVKNFPELMWEMADAAKFRHKGLPSYHARTFPTDPVKGLAKLKGDPLLLQTYLRRTKDAAKVEEIFDAFVPSDLAAENVDDIMALMRATVHEKRAAALLGTADSPAGAVADAIEEQLPAFHTKLQQSTILRQFINASRSVPAPQVEGFSRILGKVADIHDLSKALKVERHLGSIMQRIGGKKSVLEMSEGELDSVLSLMKGPRPNAQISRFLRDPMEDVTRAHMYGNKTIEFGGKKVAANQFAIPMDFAREITRVMDPRAFVEEMGGNVMKFINHVTNPFKRWITSTTLFGLPRVAFHVRNKFDLLFRRHIGAGAIAGLKTRKFKSAMAKMAGGIEGEIVLNGTKRQLKDLFNDLQRSGLLHTSFGRTGIIPSGYRKLIKEMDEGSVINPRAWLERVAKKMGWKKPERFLNPELLGTNMENAAVIELYLAQLDRGIPVLEAMDNIAATLFDYTNLTPTEKALSSIVLFYNFQRQAMPFVAKQLQQNPIIFSSLVRAKDLAFDTKREESLVPKWVRDYPLFRVSDRGGDKLTVASFRNMLTVDMLFDAPDNAHELMSKINPLLTAPVEFALGRELFMKRDIHQTKFLDRLHSESALKAVDSIGNFLQLRKTTHPKRDGGKQEMWAVNGTSWFLLNRLWFSRFFRDLDAVGRAIEGEQPRWQSLMNLLTGVKLYEYDMNRQEYFLLQNAKKAQAEYTKALRRGDRVRAVEILEEISQ